MSIRPGRSSCGPAHERTSISALKNDVLAREVSRTERDTMLPKTTAMGPIYAEYQSRAARVIPLFELRRVDSWTLDLRAAANAVESTTSP